MIMKRSLIVLCCIFVLFVPSCKDYIPFIETSFDTFEHLPETTGKIYISENNINRYDKINVIKNPINKLHA